MGCVYIATCRINGKQYIGKTVGSLTNRRCDHKKGAEAVRQPRAIFLRAIRKHGIDAFDWEELFVSESDEVLCRMEVVMIAEMGTKMPDGYNMTDGGEGTAGFVLTKETRAKIAAKATGRKVSSETRTKISSSLKGQRRSPEAVARMKAAQNRPEAKAKHRAGMNRPEVKMKMRRKRSPQGCANIKAAQIAWREKKRR